MSTVPSLNHVNEWTIDEVLSNTPIGQLVRVHHGSRGTKFLGLLIEATGLGSVQQRSARGLSLGQFRGMSSTDTHSLLLYEGVVGAPFEKLSEHRLLPFETALAVGIQICEALRELHAQRIIHGCPYFEHLIAGNDDSIKLIGHGASPRTPMTNQAELKYADPLADHSQQPTIETDLYAVGISLYRIATGQFPYLPNTIEESKARQAMLPPTIGKRSTNWPVMGIDVINKMTSLDLGKRYKTATEARNALARLSERKIVELPEPTGSSWEALPQKKQFPLWLAALIGLVLVGSAWFAFSVLGK